MGRVAATSLALALLCTMGGCGEESGVAEGATVAVYADAGLCAGAGEALAVAGREAGPVRVNLRCLQPAGGEGRLDLATVGANARRATQDSTAVAYLLEPGRGARFVTPILEAADLPWTETRAGDAAMRQVIHALESIDPSQPLRSQLQEALEAG